MHDLPLQVLAELALFPVPDMGALMPAMDDRSGTVSRPQRVTRKEAKARTTQRLLGAALAILDEEGEGSLTTTRVTKRAGIAQPSFYAHFVDMDDLLHRLIETLSLERLKPTRTARRKWRDAPHDVERLRDTYRIPIEHFVAHPQLFRLLARSQHDRTTPLGDWSRAVRERSRRALVEDLSLAGMPLDTAADRRRAEMVADSILVTSEALTMGHLDGRYPDIDEVLDVLVAGFAGYSSFMPRPTDAGDGDGSRP